MSVARRSLATFTAAVLAAALPATAASAAQEPDAGLLRLTVTQPDGAAARGSVNLVATDDSHSEFLQLDESGQLSVEVPANDYKILITPAYVDPDLPDDGLRQWVHGKTSYARAEAFRVTAGDTTDVTERLLPPSPLTVRARDAITGAPISRVCAYADGRGGNCDDTELTIPRLVPGPQTIRVYTEDGNHLAADATVNVTEGDTATAVVDLTPAAHVETTVVDAATGAPVAGACATVAPAGTGELPSVGPLACSDGTGRLRLDNVGAGSWNLFVRPTGGSPYGAQWVGATGGTGDPARARRLNLAAGRTVTVPPVRLDRAGTITGTVTSAATGAPVTSGEVSLAHSSGLSYLSWGTYLDGQGTYRIDWLGPYRWPLLFTTPDHALQWSGGVPVRGQAKPVTVRAGQSTTYSPALKRGTLVTGGLTNPAGHPVSAVLTFHNAATGEVVGSTWDYDGRYEARVLGRQTVTVGWQWGGFADYAGWYDGVAEASDAKPVTVPSTGTLTVDIGLRPFPAS
ncbi:hypothetical protein ACFFMM_03815 [Micromonospora chaiyaphumensis]|uniref:Carboxypeptidase regulatory-like domain-containing protein n=1 Tax=Micromonospora chaiyaphumensis TaxID=307119 RepID=A0A1C4ZC23_9ACTN|nr:hypothetical protein [Micromonospora chaiyaphumensis]SCF30523.1 hypothetical protein GA0070214_11385 [Micromonospora chaiyaphumensis]